MVIATLLSAALASTTPQVSIPDVLQLTDISRPTLSPDGQWVAFRTEQARLDRNDYDISWYTAPVDGSAPPRRIGDGGAGMFGDAGVLAAQSPVWSPRSNAIYVRALVDSEIQVWRLAADGSGARVISNDAANVRGLAVSPDGRSLTYDVGATRDALDRAERASHDGGVLVDASVDIAQPISRGAMVDGKLASQRFVGNWFDRGDLLWQAPRVTRTIALPADDARRDGIQPAYGHDDIIKAEIGFEGLQRPATVTFGDGHTVTCTLALCRDQRPQSAQILPDRRTVLLATSSLTYDETLTLWQPATNSMRLVAAAQGLLNGGSNPGDSCAATASDLVCVAASSTAPPQLVHVRVTDGQVTLLFDPNADLRRRSNFTLRSLVWQTKTGVRHGGVLLLPATPAPPSGYPLVISYYACPGFLRGGLGDEVPLLPLASVGIATLCINRAATDLAHEFDDYAHAVSGIGAILDQLGNEHVIDRARVGMNGLSFGSEITMQVVTKTDWLAAASIATAQLDPMLYWLYDQPGRDFAGLIKQTWGAGSPETDMAGWKRISPALNADHVHAPLLMQLPESEARGAMQLLTALNDRKQPVELYAFANEPHIKNQPRHKLAVYARNLDWFRFWLQHAEEAAPEKSEQYRRWERLAVEQRGLAPLDRARHP
jgi:dipeptidyl aminopeptidase/acylaminoacyl peptidase